jgi:TM2 domain-containing membrane protein YozV
MLMPNQQDEKKPAPLPSSAWAGFLSFLIPGMGQIYQGRIAKGVLFLVCLYGLFFYGMALGSWRNVYLPDTARANNPWGLPTNLANLYNRLHYAGQFWIGVVAWPAIYQYATFDEKADHGGLFGDFERTPSEEELNRLQRDGDKRWDLGWVYTVIAGALNILVIYDAYAGAAFAESERTFMLERQKVVAA